MDKVIETARELGRVLQADDRYIRFHTAQQRSEEDAGLQEMIGAFNSKRDEVNEELRKPTRDQERVSVLDTEMKALYKDIFENENMIRFNEARGELEKLVGFVNQIVTGSTNGQDPGTIEYQESCGGSCSSCAGCG